MPFVLGKKSLQELDGVHEALVRIVKLAIQKTTQDFIALDGLRTTTEQRALVESGASKTMDSRHLTGHAVDLVPIVNGKPRWEWGPILQVVNAVRSAAQELGIPLRWGGAWDVNLTETEEDPAFLVSEYQRRCAAKGKKDIFLDGPHFELPKALYP